VPASMIGVSTVLRLAAAAGLSCLLGFAAVPALAQSKLADVAAYQGADRDARLLQGARQEGQLILYSNAPTEDNSALIGAFQKKYGIKVQLWRAGSEEIRQRVLAEAKAGRFDVDFILNNGPALEALHAEKLLHEVRSPHLADLIPQALPGHREWVGFCLNVLVQAYNTNLIDKTALPKTYDELLDPKWKGKLGIEVDDSDWFAGLTGELGEARGLKLFRDISARNGFSVRKGHTLLTNLVAAGEVPLALTVFNYTAEQLKRKGAPIDWFVIPPLVSMPNSIAVARNAPHPHAAVLFFDFVLSDAQHILNERHYVVSNTKVESPLDRSTIKVVDSATVLTEAQKWQTLYGEAIGRRP
jgi:iron(III) transport system substrate-binding protein